MNIKLFCPSCKHIDIYEKIVSGEGKNKVSNVIRCKQCYKILNHKLNLVRD